MIDLKQIRNSDSLAPKDSPVLTGAPKAPTPAQNERDTTRIATIGFVRTAVEEVVPSPNSADEGKLLSVDSNGNYSLVTIVNSENVAY
jgi:hypothetical protein